MATSPSSAWETTLRLLSRRDRSERELRQRLTQKEYVAEAVDEAIDRARRCGYLDDARYARQKALQLLAGGRAAGPRLRLELRRAGLDAVDADAAQAEAEAAVDSETVLRSLLARRYPAFNFAAADDGQRRRVIHYFLRRGFAPELVYRVLRCSGDDCF